MTHPTPPNAWIVGGGIAALAAAVYLIREGGLPGPAVTLLCADPEAGGALDGSGSPEQGYLIRGGRMFEAHFACTWDLLSAIPSLDDPQRSVRDEIFAFNQQVVSDSHTRLLRGGRKEDVSSFGLGRRERWALMRLHLTPESALQGRRIDQWFSKAFFDSVFWQLWRSTFAFQPWSSLSEFRRYARRFLHLVPGFERLQGILRTPFNQYDALIRPLEQWLRQQGVHFEFGAQVEDIQFEDSARGRRARAIAYTQQQRPHQVHLQGDDLLLITLGSMVEGSTLGSMHTPAPAPVEPPHGAWALWQRLAERYADFGRPQVFCAQPAQSTWMSFTVTQQTEAFFAQMERFTGNRAGTGGLVTLRDSNWFMSVVLAYQPHFRNQPAGVRVFWGDGLQPDRPGNFVHKPMLDCTGEEILIELFSHLGMLEALRPELAQMNCLPCRMPYIDSQFQPRHTGDRPPVMPPGARNFAFIGQFVELADDCVFTVEYSVRSAQQAVYGLRDPARAPTALYHGEHDPRVLLAALAALKR